MSEFKETDEILGKSEYIDEDSREEFKKKRRISLKTLEFFSGIGGWASALKKIRMDHEVLQAFDINTASNETYQANFGLKPSAKTILGLTPENMDKFGADIWVMSPPCQPFTRNNQTDNRDTNDARSEPFLHLLEILQKMKSPPTYLALENVVGFESSDCCSTFLDILDKMGYVYKQYHLDPLQFGIPNSRPRYYCIARKTERILSEGELQNSPGDRSLLTTLLTNPVRSFEVKTLSSSLLDGQQNSLELPSDLLLSKSSWCLDIQTSKSSYTSCFTKSYGRYIKGTGSVLLYSLEGDQLKEIDEVPAELSNDISTRSFSDNWWSLLKDNYTASHPNEELHLRYFHPKELLSLFGFPEEFQFPHNISMKKQYELIGNSVNVTVISYLLQELFSSL